MTEPLPTVSCPNLPKVQNILALFHQLDQDISSFSRATPLRCKTGCGHCCENPQIEITVLDALPLAYHLWQTGGALRALDALERTPRPQCFFYQPSAEVRGNGRCAVYAWRPLLCRLFGFSARKNKHGQRELVTCRIIKQTFPADYEKAAGHVRAGHAVPVIAQYAARLADIDPALGQKLYPINDAFIRAIRWAGLMLKRQELSS